MYEQFFNQIPGFINPVRRMHFPNPEVNPIKPIPQVQSYFLYLNSTYSNRTYLITVN